MLPAPEGVPVKAPSIILQKPGKIKEDLKMEFNTHLAYIKFAIVEAVMSGNDEALLDLINKILINEGARD